MLNSVRSILGSPLRATAIYIAIAALWILLSDIAVLAIGDDPLTLSRLQTAKGWLFVASTGVLVGVLAARAKEAGARADAARRAADRREVLHYRGLLDRLVSLETSMGVARDLATVHRALREFVVAFVPCDRLLVSRIDPREQVRYPVYGFVNGIEEDTTEQAPVPLGTSPQSAALQLGRVVVVDDAWNEQGAAAGKEQSGLRSSVSVPLMVDGEIVGAFEVSSEERAAYTEEHVTALKMAAHLAAIATSNVLLHEREQQAVRELERSEGRFRSLVQNSSDMVRMVGSDGTILFESPAIKQILGYRPEEVEGVNSLAFVHPDDLEARRRFAEDSRAGYGRSSYRVKSADGQWRWVESIGVNLLEDPNVGAIVINSRDVTERKAAEDALREQQKFVESLLDITPGVFYLFDEGGRYVRWNENFQRVVGYESHEIKALTPFDVIASNEHDYLRGLIGEALEGVSVTADLTLKTRGGELIPYLCTGVGVTLGGKRYIAGVGLDYSAQHEARDRIQQLNADLEERLERLNTLREIDRAISGSTELPLMLSIFLDGAKCRLKVDAAAVLLHRDEANSLNFAASKGFKTNALHDARLRLGEGPAGRAALLRRLVRLESPEQIEREFPGSAELPLEDFSSYWAVPLIAKGRVRGVLELFCREGCERDDDWYEFLDAMATQAAIAIDNAVLFQKQERSNEELRLAYDATIEGWARALDLRDRETEGHSRRVTEFTVSLARELGFPAEDLVYLRWGALLHDIGKMGVPDSILLKKGSLEAEEWEIMKAHPEHAFKLLSPISFLRPAIEIPYAHHERWDGKGYPLGLKAEEIPLQARIFAVADVFDALTSERPYRPAWPREKAVEYVKAQRGRQFDPKVVDAFLAVVDDVTAVE